MERVERAWDSMAPVGREFGSSDYERLMELDHLKYEAQMKVTLGSNRGIWYDIKDTPEEAEIMKKRSFYMTALKEYIQKNGLTSTDAVRIFGISSSRITSLMKDKINVFMLSTLEKMASKVGISY
ncbi:XRE family transcriptional regulator [Undibacterium sp. RTI2.1]|uniref:helix-turn-helix domain-containing protein n=1 Tax=unclassified Undibacterium TaxID=2630295 RepID=UPI002B238E0A|nr:MULTISPECIES: XRE family transcriptional regulator [unclassified Undibacterium]MEB0033161.1 XRE family transcriptional regulator [Undibacterium sp. RTI2.1]